MIDNITDFALNEYREHYNDKKITKENIFYYIYGILHHTGYRKKYANNLTRELPHIPMAPDFHSFSKIGKQLADLHLSYETCKRYNLGPPKYTPKTFKKMIFGKIKVGDKTIIDKSTLRVDKTVMFNNIPDIKYRVNGRTPIEWAVDRYKLSTDTKSDIVNDATNIDIIPLIERLVYVGVESDRLISELPEAFEPENWEPQKAGMDRYTDGPAQSRLV